MSSMKLVRQRLDPTQGPEDVGEVRYLLQHHDLLSGPLDRRDRVQVSDIVVHGR